MDLFHIPWILFALMLLVAFLPWEETGAYLLFALIAIFVIVLWRKPMNIIHGLIGTRGNISVFVGVFLFFNFLFSGIYYFSFFKDAGITYDMSQPHVEFAMFEGIDADSLYVPKNSSREMIQANCDDSCHYYHKTDYIWVLQNTFLTSLMQEPTEFFSFTCTYNGNHCDKDKNKVLARGFNWFLVFHIMISWILLGVFISLIYQKFRNS